VHFAAHVAITPGSCMFAINAKGLYWRSLRVGFIAYP
jgi:hypothetical protein